MRALAVLVRVVRQRRWAELRDAAEAQGALLRAQVMLWTRPRGALVGAQRPAAVTTRSGSDEERLRCERLACAVNRAARFGVFRPRCLARAVALSDLLAAHGIEGHRIRIGVRTDGGAFVAHAWVELGSWVLGDTVSATRSYAPLTDVRVAAGRFSA